MKDNILVSTLLGLIISFSVESRPLIAEMDMDYKFIVSSLFDLSDGINYKQVGTIGDIYVEDEKVFNEQLSADHSYAFTYLGSYDFNAVNGTNLAGAELTMYKTSKGLFDPMLDSDSMITALSQELEVFSISNISVSSLFTNNLQILFNTFQDKVNNTVNIKDPSLVNSYYEVTHGDAHGSYQNTGEGNLNFTGEVPEVSTIPLTTVPVPSAVWMFSVGVGLMSISRRTTKVV